MDPVRDRAQHRPLAAELTGSGDGADGTWDQALDGVLADPASWSLALQPIVDLQRGAVVGHEVLSRFPTEPVTGPDRWFAAAERLGRGPALSAATIARGLGFVAHLPPNTFLTVNLEPGHATHPDVRAAFATVPDLARVFVEVTEHGAIDDLDGVRGELAELRARGARIAIDDAGAGYAGLGVLLALRPQLVKLDGALVTGLDHDPVKRVLVRALGELAGSIDAWVLAEGIENADELAALIELGVPLGQGYHLGHPAPAFTGEVPIEVAATILDRVQRRDHDLLLVGLVDDAPSVTLVERPEPDPRDVGPVVVVDELDRPVALDPGGGTRHHAPLLVRPSEARVAAGRRVAARPDAQWHHPLVVTDGRGAYLGVVRIPRLLEALAWQSP